MSLTEPIVEGAYYERADFSVVGPARRDHGVWELSRCYYDATGSTLALPKSAGVDLARRVYLVPTDPADVVAELRKLEDEAHSRTSDDDDYREDNAWEAYGHAADLVAEKLGVKS